MSFYSNCAIYLVRTGKHERAMQLFSKALSAEGGAESVPLKVNILLCSFRLKRYGDCLQCLDDIEVMLGYGDDCISRSAVRRLRVAIKEAIALSAESSVKSEKQCLAENSALLSIDTVTLNSPGMTNMPRSLSFTSTLKSPSKKRLTLARFSIASAPIEVYPYHRLVSPQSSYPKEVNVNEREKYLSDAEFLDVFGMTKYDFAALPEWRQVQKKRECKLF